MNSRLGIRVFPNEASDEVLRSPSLLHFSPTPEPPVDYTIKAKPRRPDYQVTRDIFRREVSPDYEHEEDALRVPSARKPRRSTQVVGEVITGRRSTLTESEKILAELNTTLEEAMTSTSSPRSAERRRSMERVKRLAEKGQRAQIAPVLRPEVVEDLHKLSQGQDVTSINENRHQVVLEMYDKTKRLIEKAHSTYTKEYFIPQYAARTIPEWQKQLLATRASKEMLKSYEEKAWEEFDEWKRRCAPQIQLQPNYRYVSRPTLY